MEIRPKTLEDSINYCPVDSLTLETPPQNLLNKIASKDPLLCECAHFGKRKLSWASWVPWASNSEKYSFLDRNNVELSHEHLVFDSTKDNIGFGPKGVFSEDINSYQYHYDNTCYDGTLMRKIIGKLKEFGKYWLVGNNCQVFSENLKKEYEKF